MEDKLVTIAVQTYSRAQILQTRLQDEGIECYLSNVNLIHSVISGGVKVRVNEKDLDAALRVVEKVSELYRGKEEDLLDKKVQRILVPIDFSDYSVNACRYAVGLATKLGAEIKLMHVYYNPIINSMPLTDTYYYQVNMDEIIREIEVRAKRNIEKFYQDLQKQLAEEGISDVKLDYALQRGIASEEIIRKSEDYEPDVIIIGTRGAGAQENDLIGSVTAKVMEEAKVPLLVIPEDAKYEGIHTINILYVTDFDDSDYVSIKKLMRLMEPFSIRFYCMHVGDTDSSSWDKAKMNHMREKLAELGPSREVDCQIVEGDDPVKAVEAYIQEKRIDILSMVTHKQGLLARFFRPDMARKVLFHTNTPFLVFHAKD